MPHSIGDIVVTAVEVPTCSAAGHALSITLAQQSACLPALARWQ